MIKKKIIIFLFLLSSCGYQPIFVDSKSNKLIFKEIELTGEKNINRKIISISGLKEDSQNFTYSKLKIDSKKRIIETSKNASPSLHWLSSSKTGKARAAIRRYWQGRNNDQLKQKKI